MNGKWVVFAGCGQRRATIRAPFSVHTRVATHVLLSKLAAATRGEGSLQKVPGTERQYPRYAHEATVRFRGGDVVTEGRTRNLSRGGLCATVTEQLPVGSDIDVEIVLLFDDDSQSEALKVEARVVWCTPIEESFQLGVSFRPMDATRAEYLTLFLKYLSDDKAPNAPRAQSVDDRFR